MKNITMQVIRDGDLVAFENLFHTYYPGLFLFAKGILYDSFLAEDVVQNLFIHLWEKSGSLNINVSVKSYLYRSVHNRCMNKIKELRIVDKHNLLYQEGMWSSISDEMEENSELQKKIDRALSQLPIKMAEIFKLRYLENKKPIDIAKALNVSENTVKTQLLRAKLKLRQLLS